MRARLFYAFGLILAGCGSGPVHHPSDGGAIDFAGGVDFAMPPDMAQTIPRNGLVGEWLFAGNTRDTSGNGFDGTDNGAALTKDRSGHVNAALFFNGIDAYVSITDADLLDLAGSYTVSAWVRADALNANAGIVSKYSSIGSQGFTLRLSDQTPYAVVHFDEASRHITLAGGLQLDTGNWHPL